jgi:hypothetical protein
MLVWKTTTPIDSAFHEFSYLIVAGVIGDSVTPEDTVARVDAASWAYMGGAWGRRRWVVSRDGQSLPQRTFLLYRSDGFHDWRQMRTSDLSGAHGIVLAPLDSARTLIVASEWDYRLRWGILRDTTWSTEPEPVAEYGPHGPSLTRQPDGGIRVAWSSYDDFIRTRVYKDGAWAEPETIRAVLPEPVQHLFYQASVSREESQHPAMSWYGYGLGADVAYYIWVAFPTDSGFALGERLPGSWSGINPTCLVDENGDVWVAWWREYDGIYWTHSYCTALPSTPAVGEKDGRPNLSWTLSESAPGTYWAVMRGDDGAPGVSIARVRAGPGPGMSWADSAAPPGTVLRYSIRRESRDVRYRLTSAEAEWRPRGTAIALFLRSANPAGSVARVKLSGASAGDLELTLYDLLGRQIMQRRQKASGSGVDQFELQLGDEIHPGLYLLRVRGADGRMSPAAKVVVVK